MKMPANKWFLWLINIEINKPKMSGIVGTNLGGIRKIIFSSCVTIIMTGIAITASQKLVWIVGKFI